jgi:two-component system, NtrC family, sensor kinase
MGRPRMRFLSRWSLSTKINAGIALVVLIFGLVSTIMVVRITSRSLLDEIKKRGASLTLNLAARSAEPLLAQDFLRLKDVVDEIKASSDDILYAFVLDKNGQVMSHTFKDGFPVALIETNIFPPRTAEHIELLDVGSDLVYDFAVPIRVGPNQLGTTRIGLSRAKAQATVDSLVQTVISFSLGTALAAIILGTIFAGTVIRRLNALRQSAEEIVKGNLDLMIVPPQQQHCWEIHNCRHEDCPAHGDILHRCWHLPGTCYHQGEENRGATKNEDCRFCKVYLENRGDEIQTLAEAFDVMAYSLKNHIGNLQQAQQNIRRQQQILQTILDGTPDLVSLQDENLHYRAVNQAFGSFFGIQEKDILGKGPDFRFGQEILGQNTVEDWEVVSQGRFISKEIEFSQGQRKRWFHLVKLPIYDGSRIAGLLCTARDISELKNYQEKMIQSLKMEELGKLAGGLADELKTPLGIILGYTKILLEDTHEAELLEPLNIIDKQAQVGYRIVSDLLSFSRQGAGVRKNLDVNKSIQEMAQLVRHTFQQDKVAIVTDLAPEIPDILGDEATLKQVWMHLLNNAYESLPQGGVIALSTRFAQDKGVVLISVADNGPGLNPEDREKVFEPFFNTRATSLGISLGLSYAYAVIKDHQGHISVYSPVLPEYARKPAGSGNANGPGTQFLIELPIRLEKPSAVESRDSAAPPPEPPLLPA